jgi:hypothetical protein
MRMRQVWFILMGLSVLQGNLAAYLTFAPIKDGSEYAVVDCDPLASGVVDVPELYNGRWVTEIAVEAFADCYDITVVTMSWRITSVGERAFVRCRALRSISLSASLTQIGKETFADCMALETITLPSALKRIGAWAFRGCVSLGSVTFPAGLEVIGVGAFAHCPELAMFGVESGNQHFKSVDGVLFTYDLRSLLLYPNRRSPLYAIPEGTHSIGYFAFRGCTALTRITIPSSVAVISTGALSYCRSLSSVEIPSGVTRIGNYAFESCSSLVEVSLPSGLEEIGRGAFADCPFVELEFPVGLKRIGDHAFMGCYQLREVSLPESLTHLGHGAFSNCGALEQVTFQGPRPAAGHNVFARSSGSESQLVVRYTAGQDGWESPFQGLETVSSVRTWGGYDIVETEAGEFVDTSSWMGWLEISQSPMVWHVEVGTWLYFTGGAVETSSGWVCCLNGNDMMNFDVTSFEETPWSWSDVLNKWIYLPSSARSEGPVWFFVLG